jgi:hypothetical protein
MNEENKLYYPLNGYEMLELNPDAKLINYSQLNEVFTPKELFGNYKKIIILYLLQSKQSGHWVCLFLNNQGIQFFDSYGKLPDAQIDNLTVRQRIEYNQQKNRLHDILKNYDVYYNDKSLQKKGTQTCGCFVSHRLANYELTDNEYIDAFKDYNIKDPDEFVASYCLKKLEKNI